jgi:hypothetical protein
MAVKQVYTIPKIAKVEIIGVKYKVPSGNRGNENLISPYVPNFSKRTAKITDPNVGASTWASGNQICNGNTGIFAAKAIKNVIQRKC